MFYDYDDIEYKRIRDVGNLFDLSIDKGYYKPIRANSAFNSNNIEYKSKGDKDKIFSIKEYLYMIMPYLSDIINNHKTQGKWKVHSDNKVIDYKTQGEWKIHLSTRINFMSSKDSDEIRTMHTVSKNIEIMICNETSETIEKNFKSLLQKYQEKIEESMRESGFVFDIVDLLYYKLQKISLNRGRSYIDSSKWLRNKKATINLKKKDDKCFQYAVAVALNNEQIKINPERLLKIKPFIDQYNWKEINFPPDKKNWKKFESNDKSIPLNIVFVLYNTKEISLAYKSKYNLKRKN